MKKIKKVTRIQWLIMSGLLLLIVFFLLNEDLIKLLLNGDVETLRTFLNKNMGYALFFMALVMLIQNSFTVFPLILVITINITIFGPINGFLWSWLTSVFASVIVFYCVRYIFQSMIINKFNAKLIEKVDKNGFAYVFQARLFPFVPTSLVNILAGLSTIRIVPFTIATAIGNFLYFFVLALIPIGILSSEMDTYVIIVIIFATALLYYLYKFIFNKKKSIIKPDHVD